MGRSQNRCRGAAIGVSALAGLGIAALGVVGVTAHDGAAVQQREVSLTAGGVAPNPGFNDAHDTLIAAQVAQDHSYFDQNVLGLQESIYYNAVQNGSASSLFPGDTSDPQDSLFNGAFTRYFEAQEVTQAIQQAQWDHLLGVNQTLGPGGYETHIAGALYSDISGSGIPATGSLHDAVEALNPATSSVLESASGFHDALVTLQGDLMQTAVSDWFGMFGAGL
ncbi:MAG TPA: hypothetical protein VFR17_08905 [Mycobacterium sp.]|nr:hypothetical protein [Mycobacterium sp.]